MENFLPPQNGGGMWQWFFGKSVANIEFINVGSLYGFVGVATPSLSRILLVCDLNLLASILVLPRVGSVMLIFSWI